MFEVIAFNTEYPDEDSFPIFSGSEDECEEFFSSHKGYYDEGNIIYRLEIWQIEEDND